MSCIIFFSALLILSIGSNDLVEVKQSAYTILSIHLVVSLLSRETITKSFSVYNATNPYLIVSGGGPKNFRELSDYLLLEGSSKTPAAHSYIDCGLLLITDKGSVRAGDILFGSPCIDWSQDCLVFWT